MMKAPSACHKVMWPQNCWATGMIHAPSTKSDVAAEFVRRLAVRSPPSLDGTTIAPLRTTHCGIVSDAEASWHCFQGGSIMVILLMRWKQTAQVSQLKSEMLFVYALTALANTHSVCHQNPLHYLDIW